MYRNVVANCLSREHQEAAHLMRRFGGFLSLHSASSSPDWSQFEARDLAKTLALTLNHEIKQHFALEESSIFPFMEDEGLGDLVEILLADHKEISKLVLEIEPHLRAAGKGEALSDTDWAFLFRKGNALVTDLIAHIEKEENGLIPLIEESMNESKANEILVLYEESQRAPS